MLSNTVTKNPLFAAWKNSSRPKIGQFELDRLANMAIEVLKELDPMFEMAPEERYTANIHGKVLTYSHNLRKGISETLALLGTQPEALNNCSFGKAEAIPAIVIRAIFDDSDWTLWGSLNYLLPTLAEAAPDEFLRAVENALKKTPCPFDDLFSQEGSGITGGNYMSGLLWALEGLAWDPEYLVRVTFILGNLASHDPGGNWGNRPANSLATMFLPWLPQTTAPIQTRKVAVTVLLKEFPEIGWKLLLALLPNQHQTSMGSHKPQWRKFIPDDFKKGATNQQYWEQVSCYSEMAVEAAKNDHRKLSDLIKHLHNLPTPSLERLIATLQSEMVKSWVDEDKRPIWDALASVARLHKRHSDAEWTFAPEMIKRIEDIAASLEPQRPQDRYRHVFGNSDFEFYDRNESLEEEERKLEEVRQHAIRLILKDGGFNAVFKFSDTVDCPRRVGYSLGVISDQRVDRAMLPAFLENEDGKVKEFTSAYVFARYKTQGSKWFDQLEAAKWPKEQIGLLLSFLPSNQETWDYATKLLKDNEAEYWKQASVYPYDCKTNWDYAAEKLIQYERPNAALSCLNPILRKEKKLTSALAIRALLNVTSTEEFDRYNTAEIITALQNDPDVNPDDLLQIEWAYLPILTGPGKSAIPKRLEQKLASDPDFFCELVRLIYRSKNAPPSPTESTEQEKSSALNAWRLLADWATLPGMSPDGSFSTEAFNLWINAVKAECMESGHFDIAMLDIGTVLVHYIPDPDGLWLHKAVAEALNSEDADKMRRGFTLGIYNSRGVYSVDPTGKPERELAASYRTKATEIETAGYHRLAIALRTLADHYERDAQRVIDECQSLDDL